MLLNKGLVLCLEKKKKSNHNHMGSSSSRLCQVECRWLLQRKSSGGDGFIRDLFCKVFGAFSYFFGGKTNMEAKCMALMEGF